MTMRKMMYVSPVAADAKATLRACLLVGSGGYQETNTTINPARGGGSSAPGGEEVPGPGSQEVGGGGFNAKLRF